MPNHFLREAPFVRLIFPIILGICLYPILGYWHRSIPYVLVIAILVFTLCSSQLPTRFKHKFNTVIGIGLALILIVFGYSSTYNFYDSNRPDYVQPGSEQESLVQVVSHPQLSGKFHKVVAQVIHQGGRKTQGKVQLYLEVGERTPTYGDLIIVAAELKKISGPKNPCEFDYRAFMRNQNIEYQAFVPFNLWLITSQNHGNLVIRHAFNLREKLKRIIDVSFNKAEYAAILHALVLGDKSGLDKNLKKTFSETGTMHVLAVSGLHVGIVYLFATTLLGFLLPNRLKVFKLVISLLVIWSFALLSGLSPSVCRACFMFSVLSIGLELKRYSSVYNSLALAAFVLLLINPLNLFNVGFQFSFLAVIGIVTFQKPLRSYVQTSSFFWGKILDLSAVSFAAQMATLPLGLYYFGQFPILFLVSNLFVIPAVTILVYGSILLFVLNVVPFLAKLIAFVIKIYLWFVTFITEWLQKVPLALIENVSITQLELILLFGIIITLGISLVKSSKRSMILCMLTCSTFMGSQAIRSYHNINSSELIQYDLGRSNLTVLRVGADFNILSAEAITEKNWEFHCLPYLVYRGVRDCNFPKQNSIQIDSFAINNVKYRNVFCDKKTRRKAKGFSAIPLK